MKRLHVFLLLLLVCFDFGSNQPGYAKENQDAVAAIVAVQETAYVVHGAGGLKTAAKPGASLYPQDTIEVSKEGAIKLLFNDHSVIDLAGSTQFKIEEYVANHGADRQVEISMRYGSMRSAIAQKLEGKGKFHIRTQSATMGVRGTELVVKADNVGNGKGSTQVTVLQGQVEVGEKSGSDAGDSGSHGGGHSKSITLAAGQQIVASAGVPLPVKATTLDAASLSKVSSSSKVVDNTFSHAITIATSSNSSSSGSGSSGSARTVASSERAPASSSGSSSTSGGTDSSGGGTASSGSSASTAPAAGNAPASGGGDSPAGGGGAGVSAGAASAGPGTGGDAPPASSAGGGVATAAPGPGDAPPPSSGGGGLGGAGGSTLSDIGTIVSVAASGPPPINTTQIGINGSFNPGTTAATPVNNTSTSSNVFVVITHK